jgi:hypothetical protein
MSLAKNDVIDVLEKGNVPSLLRALQNAIGVEDKDFTDTASNAVNDVESLVKKIDKMKGSQLAAVLIAAAPYISKK